MDRKTSLRGISAVEIRSELIDRLREQIRKNDAENDRLRDQIRQLNPHFVTVSGTFRLPAEFPATQRSRNSKPLRDVIVEVLRGASEPVRVKDVVALVKQSGYASNAENFPAIVSISLSKNEHVFEKVRRGVYRVRGNLEL